MMNIALLITVATALCYAGIASANGQSRKSASGSAERKATTGGKTESPSDLSHCLSAWDAGTHITRARWREICRQQHRATQSFRKRK
jgi:hypothetical protein